jgi:hypothetical protein
VSFTLLIVGSAIILFGVVIPERLGMALEFCVALMLIVLGLLNLGSLRRSVDEVQLNGHSRRHGFHLRLRPLVCRRRPRIGWFPPRLRSLFSR